MEKQSNVLVGAALLITALGAFVIHGFIASDFFLFLSILFMILGAIKFLNLAALVLPKPLAKLCHWIHSLAFEALSIFGAFLLRPLGFVKRVHGKRGPDAGRPILMIHGYLQNGSNWEYLKRVLAQQGLGPIYSLNLIPPFHSIPDFSALVSQKAEEIAKETGRPDLTIIGHSMGGLVASWYASKVADSGRVPQVITVASPLNGTYLAAIALGPNGRQMRINSDFVQNLQQELANPKSTAFYHIATETDQLVFPYTSALTGRNPEREYLLPDIGHMTLLFSKRVARKITEWLN